MSDEKEIAKWREAHQGIYMTEVALGSVAPFPSLYATDFAVYLESKGANHEIVRFVVDMQREMAWVYDNWAKAQFAADPGKLLDDMLNGATSQGEADYSLVRQYIRDYAEANGIGLRADAGTKPSWMTALEEEPIEEIEEIEEEPVEVEVAPAREPGTTRAP